jgi:hypothetical protein
MSSFTKRFVLSLLATTIMAGAITMLTSTKSKARARDWCAVSQSMGVDCAGS